MDSTSDQSKPWSNVQAYSLAVICMLVGVVVGYLLHAPSQTVRAKSAMGAPAPGASPQMSGGTPNPEQMKQMGDKMAEPMLAALAKDPNNADLLAQIGSVYFRAQQFPTAIEYYQRAVNVKPTAPLLVALSNSYHYAGLDERAIATLNRALEVDPKWGDALFNLGMLKWQVENNPQAAIETWQRMLKLNPDHPRRAYVESMIARAKQHQNLPAGAKTNKPAL
jgi:cytochrome c-type biogenesis protein CcmH/NrfG